MSDDFIPQQGSPAQPQQPESPGPQTDAAAAPPPPMAEPAAPPPPPAPGIAAPYAPPIGGAPSAPSSGVGLAVVAAIIAAFIVGALAGAGGGYLGAQLALRSPGTSTSANTNVTVVPSTTDEPVVAAAAAAVPSVVNIDVSEKASSGSSHGLPSSHPDMPVGGNGSGVAFRNTSDGGTYILTNNHVVEKATSILVRSPAGKSWPGTVVGRDTDTDVAIIKIAGKLPAIKIGDSKAVRVGQTVVAIGSPYGLEHSVTSGVVSALGRSLSDIGATGQAQPLVNTIQTDAAINPGNSGGALVDRQGRLIGINTAIYTQSGSAAGIGFAIPVDTAVEVASEIIKDGKVTHPFIGLAGTDVTPLTARANKLPVQEGALVESTIKGLGAEKAGIVKDDIVTAVDGTPIASMTDLVAQIRKHEIGSTATLTIMRNGKQFTVKVPVSDKPSTVSTSVPSTATPSNP